MHEVVLHLIQEIFDILNRLFGIGILDDAADSSHKLHRMQQCKCSLFQGPYGTISFSRAFWPMTAAMYHIDSFAVQYSVYSTLTFATPTKCAIAGCLATAFSSLRVSKNRLRVQPHLKSRKAAKCQTACQEVVV